MKTELEQPQYPTVPSLREDEITLRELILKSRKYWTEIRRNWLIILLITLPFVAYFGYKAFIKPVTYTAQLTFMLNDNQGSGGIASLLGQFSGLLGSSGNDYKLERILEIAHSRRIISTTLFKKYTLDGQEDFFANHIIRIQRLHEKWKKDTTLNGFLFTRGNLASFNRKENKALLALYGEMIGGEDVERPMFGTNLNDDTSIMTLSLNSADEMLAIDLLNTLYEDISAFYIEKSIERERETLEILAQKRDSIGRLLNNNDVASAGFQDQNNGLLLEMNKVSGRRYQRTNNLLTIVYGEAIKNVELADFSMKSNTPFLSLIDVPIPPIKPDARGRIKALIIGLVLGLTLGSLFIISRLVVREAMENNT